MDKQLEVMRKILFRGKRKDIGVWEKGYYCRHERRQVCPIDDELREDESQHLIMYDEFADWNMPKRLSAVEVLPETVGQFTGLSDKNGKWIFEGDIVKYDDYIFVVKYGKCGGCANDLNYGYMGFYVDAANCKTKKYMDCGLRNDICYFTDIEVIGNIHDNPELLEAAEA